MARAFHFFLGVSCGVRSIAVDSATERTAEENDTNGTAGGSTNTWRVLTLDGQDQLAKLTRRLMDGKLEALCGFDHLSLHICLYRCEDACRL